MQFSHTFQTLGLLLICPLLGVVSLCFSESIFTLHPLIDTRLPQGFSEVNFNKIQPKMTKAEVFRLIQAQPDKISVICSFTQLGTEDKENKKLPKVPNDFTTRLAPSCWKYGRDGRR